MTDADLFTARDRDPVPTPRKCVRHRWVETDYLEAFQWCERCHRIRNPGLTRRSRNNRARGGREEALVAQLLGGRKVGQLGLPHDVEVPGYLRVQTKRLDRWPSLAKVIEWLDAMTPGAEMRVVTIADTPGPGGRARRLLIVELEEFATWHGRTER